MVRVAVQALIPASLLQEGLHAGPLQEFIDNVDKEREKVRLRLLHFFASEIQQHGLAVSKPTLQAMVSLASLPSPSDTELKLAEQAQQFLDIQERNEALQAELKAAQAAADLEATLREFQTYLENGQYNEAAWSVVQLRKILEANRSAGSGAGTYGWQQQQGSAGSHEMAALAAACARCEQNLAEALEASCHEAFDVEREQCVATITSALPSGGGVGDLWAAMELAGLQDRHLQWVADTLLEDILPPVLLGSARLAAHIAPGSESAIVQWPPAHTHGPSSHAQHAAPAAPLVEQSVCDLLRVLGSALFAGRQSTVAAFGALFWGRFVEQYKGAFLEVAGGASVEVLRARQEGAKDMEKVAVALGLTTADASLHELLSRAVAQSYHLQQEAYLAQARAVLAAADPRTPPVSVGLALPLNGGWYERYKRGEVAAWELLDPPSGWDVNGPVFATGFCLVNQAVIELGRVINTMLCDAVDSGDKSCAQALVVAVSKMAAMYMAAGPGSPHAINGGNDALFSSPQASLMYHNDLIWLSRHLLMLPFLFNPDLETILGGEAWFGDEAAQLKDAAKRVLRDQLAAQRAELGQALADVQAGMHPGAQGGGGLSGMARGKGAAGGAGGAGIAARTAVRQLLHSLGRAGRLVWHVLAPGAALDFSARLLGPLLQQLADDILARRDIGEDECAEFGELLGPLAGDAVGAVVAHVGVDGAGIGIAAPEGFDVRALIMEAICQRTWGLRKLRVLLRLLNARLAEIQRDWESGQLANEGLVLREARHMVCALFQDTDFRAEVLQRMEVAGYP